MRLFLFFARVLKLVSHMHLTWGLLPVQLAPIFQKKVIKYERHMSPTFKTPETSHFGSFPAPLLVITQKTRISRSFQFIQSKVPEHTFPDAIVVPPFVIDAIFAPPFLISDRNSALPFKPNNAISKLSSLFLPQHFYNPHACLKATYAASDLDWLECSSIILKNEKNWKNWWVLMMITSTIKITLPIMPCLFYRSKSYLQLSLCDHAYFVITFNVLFCKKLRIFWINLCFNIARRSYSTPFSCSLTV